MAPKKDEDYVTFLNAAGDTVSNDPRYQARKLLEAAGESTDSSEAEAQNAELRRQLEDMQTKLEAAQRAAAESAAASGLAGVEDDATEDDDADEQDEFSTMTGRELKAYAKENKVDISGMTKVGEVRTALRASKA